MRSVANVVVVGSLCAVATERGWPQTWMPWTAFAMVLVIAMLAEGAK